MTSRNNGSEMARRRPSSPWKTQQRSNGTSLDDTPLAPDRARGGKSETGNGQHAVHLRKHSRTYPAQDQAAPRERQERRDGEQSFARPMASPKRRDGRSMSLKLSGACSSFGPKPRPLQPSAGARILARGTTSSCPSSRNLLGIELAALSERTVEGRFVRRGSLDRLGALCPV